MTTTTPPSFAVGSWAFSAAHGESVRILDVETVWNHTVYQVWIPRLATVERVPAESLSPAQPTKATGLDRITYAVAAARIADALTQDVLLAPLEAGVIPLPHQLHALTRAVTGDRVRYLLADEVGLGKTIEAGLIFRELKLRGLVKRVLVVAPKGLVTQWVQEMQTHFGEEFRLLTPSEFSSWRNLTGAENVWRQFDQVVCPVDSIKPVERRRGWSREKLEAYNQERLGDLIDAGWDLIICDEAHRLGGSTEQVARYRLGKALAEAAPYLLLLSATPHQGKTAGFQRLMALLDRDEFIAAGSIRREKVVPFVIRTEKRRAINDRGDPLFMPRLTKLMPVRWEEKHKLQKHLYESVTEYVRLGYNQAMRQNRQYLGFLMILMQRLVTSSTQAIASAMERRLEALQATEPDGHRRGTARSQPGRTGQPGAVGRTAGDPAGRTAEREGRSQAAARSGPPLSGPGAGRTGRDAARHPLREPAGREQPGVEVPDLHRVRADAEHAAGLPGAARLLGRLPQRVDGPGGAAAGPAAVRREGPNSRLDRRRWRRSEPAIRPHRHQLRPALEPDADRAAHRACGPYRPEAPGEGVQPDLRGQRGTAGAGSPRREAGDDPR